MDAKTGFSDNLAKYFVLSKGEATRLIIAWGNLDAAVRSLRPQESDQEKCLHHALMVAVSNINQYLETHVKAERRLGLVPVIQALHDDYTKDKEGA